MTLFTSCDTILNNNDGIKIAEAEVETRFKRQNKRNMQACKKMWL